MLATSIMDNLTNASSMEDTTGISLTMWLNSTNTTDQQEQPILVDFTVRVVAVALYGVTLVLIICCNVLNLYIMRKPLDCFSDITRFFLRALAAIDLFSGLICCPTEMVLAFYGNWPHTHATCDFIAIIYTMVSCQALLCLCLVSVDRYLTIIKPLHYPTIMTERKAWICLIGVLVVGALLSLVMLVARDQPTVYDDQRVCALLYLDSADALPLLIIIIVVSFFIPASVLLFVNIRLMMITIQKTRELANMSPTAVRYTTDRLKGVRTILVLTSAFFVTWLPLISTMISAIVFNAIIPPALGTIIALPPLCNSWINAVIYLFMCRAYRRAVVKQVRKCFKQRHEKWVTNGSVAASAALHSEAVL